MTTPSPALLTDVACTICGRSLAAHRDRRSRFFGCRYACRREAPLQFRDRPLQPVLVKGDGRHVAADAGFED